MMGMLDFSNLFVREGTGLRRGTGFPLVLTPVVLVSLSQNQCFNFSLLYALLLNLEINSKRLVFKLFMFESSKTWSNVIYCSWYIMLRPVLRHRSSMLFSSFVISVCTYISPDRKLLSPMFHTFLSLWQSWLCNTATHLRQKLVFFVGVNKKQHKLLSSLLPQKVNFLVDT